MNKRAIWAIILLMSIGLMGSAVLQIYWFRSAITLQEQRFDNDVFDALNAIQQRLIIEEEKNLSAFEVIGNLNDPASTLYRQGWVKKEFTEFLSESQQIREEAIHALQNLSDTLLSEEEFVNLVEPQDEWRQMRMKVEMMDSRARMRDLESRLDPQLLDDIIHHELANQGIDIECEYGVYSNKGQSYVILNGMYVVEEGATEASSSEFSSSERTLHNSKYQIQLFTKDPTPLPPGALRIHFPNKSSWLWASLIPALIGTIIFTGLILFCFGYTIWVIFRQKKVSEMKTDFINNMTHEFKTPIATISLASDSITSPMVISSKDKIQRFANIIKQENKRMLSQVEKVLQMAQIDKREFELKVSRFDMHELIDQAIENANLQVQKRGGQISKELTAGDPIIHGDQTHLSNVIHNLLDNANKYSPETPEISVRTRNVSGGVEVIVEDHGIGMTKEARKQIFDKFYRVHTGNRHDVKGFGLGLSYVKAITDAHNGKIDVKSEPDQGSSFILYFPHKGPKHSAA